LLILKSRPAFAVLAILAKEIAKSVANETIVKQKSSLIRYLEKLILNKKYILHIPFI